MLLSSPVPKNINKVNRLFGFDLFDCFLILGTFAILNFILAGSILSWIISLGFSAILHFGKKDKTEGIMVDTLQYLITPKVFSAAFKDQKWRPYLRD